MQRIQGLTGPSLMVRLNSVHYVQEHVPQLLQIVQDRCVHSRWYPTASCVGGRSAAGPCMCLMLAVIIT